jgi:CTP:molybdopterin cytidylyltransferase MocA
MGEFKPLKPLEGVPLIQRTVASLLNGGVEALYLVTGRESERIQAALDVGLGSDERVQAALDAGASSDERIICVHNADFATTDMLHSIRLGLQALKDAEEQSGCYPVDAVFILPGDIPAVRPETIAALRAFAQITTAPIVCPSYQGADGHPLLISSECFATILDFTGEGGLKAAVAPFEISRLTVDDRGVSLDADTPEAFEELASFIRNEK